uniref:Uncharacterized protein n=1 Tax=Parascaris univalens TaxID=6257 RepID=A0A915BBS6_PARUN
LYFRIRLARICDLCLCFCKLQSCLQLRSDGKGVEREAREERVGLWHWPANVTVHSNNNFPPFRKRIDGLWSSNGSAVGAGIVVRCYYLIGDITSRGISINWVVPFC